MKTMFALTVAAFLAVPFASFAQTSRSEKRSVESLSVEDIADDSIVVLSQEDTGISDYVHTKYAFNCLGELRLVDYYGSAVDPNDPTILLSERAMCSRQHMNDYEGESE